MTKLDKDILFDLYQRMIEWVDRRRKPDTAEFYNESPETWKHAKEVAFMMYQDLRHFVDGGAPDFKSIDYDPKYDELPPHKFDNGYECKCCGMIHYRDRDYPVYNDDYGMSSFIVLDGRTIQVDGMGGMTDWYFEIDRVLDKIYD